MHPALVSACTTRVNVPLNGRVRWNCGQSVPHTFGTEHSVSRMKVSSTGVVPSIPEQAHDGTEVGRSVTVVVCSSLP